MKMETGSKISQYPQKDKELRQIGAINNSIKKEPLSHTTTPNKSRISAKFLEKHFARKSQKMLFQKYGKSLFYSETLQIEKILIAKKGLAYTNFSEIKYNVSRSLINKTYSKYDFSEKFKTLWQFYQFLIYAPWLNEPKVFKIASKYYYHYKAKREAIIKEIISNITESRIEMVNIDYVQQIENQDKYRSSKTKKWHQKQMLSEINEKILESRDEEEFDPKESMIGESEDIADLNNLLKNDETFTSFFGNENKTSTNKLRFPSPEKKVRRAIRPQVRVKGSISTVFNTGNWKQGSWVHRKLSDINVCSEKKKDSNLSPKNPKFTNRPLESESKKQASFLKKASSRQGSQREFIFMNRPSDGRMTDTRQTNQKFPDTRPQEPNLAQSVCINTRRDMSKQDTKDTPQTEGVNFLSFLNIYGAKKKEETHPRKFEIKINKIKEKTKVLKLSVKKPVQPKNTQTRPSTLWSMQKLKMTEPQKMEVCVYTNLKQTRTREECGNLSPSKFDILLKSLLFNVTKKDYPVDLMPPLQTASRPHLVPIVRKRNDFQRGVSNFHWKGERLTVIERRSGGDNYRALAGFNSCQKTISGSKETVAQPQCPSLKDDNQPFKLPTLSKEYFEAVKEEPMTDIMKTLFRQKEDGHPADKVTPRSSQILLSESSKTITRHRVLTKSKLTSQVKLNHTSDPNDWIHLTSNQIRNSDQKCTDEKDLVGIQNVVKRKIPHKLDRNRSMKF